MENKDHLIPVEIFGFYNYEAEGVTVFLKGDDVKVVPIVIGEFEAQALLMALQKQEAPRPMPYDLLETVLERTQGKIRQLVIHTLKEHVFHAYLLIDTGEKALLLDCRPSDGLVMATRLGAPIYITPEVMEEASVEPGTS